MFSLNIGGNNKKMMFYTKLYKNELDSKKRWKLINKISKLLNSSKKINVKNISTSGIIEVEYKGNNFYILITQNSPLKTGVVDFGKPMKENMR